MKTTVPINKKSLLLLTTAFNHSTPVVISTKHPHNDKTNILLNTKLIITIYGCRLQILAPGFGFVFIDILLNFAIKYKRKNTKLHIAKLHILANNINLIIDNLLAFSKILEADDIPPKTTNEIAVNIPSIEIVCVVHIIYFIC